MDVVSILKLPEFWLAALVSLGTLFGIVLVKAGTPLLENKLDDFLKRFMPDPKGDPKIKWIIADKVVVAGRKKRKRKPATKTSKS